VTVESTPFVERPAPAAPLSRWQHFLQALRPPAPPPKVSSDPSIDPPEKPAPGILRWRNVYLAGGCIVILSALLWRDPDQGTMTGDFILSLVAPLLAVGLAHLTRKALTDYPSSDMEALFARARKSSVGAGLALVALAILLHALLGLFGQSARAEQPHPRAVALAPVLRAEVAQHWADLPWPHYVPGLIEHESCVTLTSSRCWTSSAELRSKREQGVGLGQLTRTFRPDGSTRFDTLADLRAAHPALIELDWSTLRQRPDLQIRALVIQSRMNWFALRAVEDDVQRLAMTDAAYNGGLAGLQRERRYCGGIAGCNPGKWFGNVERHCLKSRQPLYAGRSACDINRDHPVDVILRRMPRYRDLMTGA
jgi:hypothetical protein